MKLFKCIYLDWVIGVKKNKRYFLLMFISLINCWQFKSMCLNDGLNNTRISLVDCMAFIQQGVVPLKNNSSLEAYYIPTVWLLWLLAIFLMPLDYPYKTRKLWGNQYTVRVGKVSWWFSKCIYTVIVNIVSFIIYILVLICFCLVNRYGISLKSNQMIYEYLFSYRIDGKMATVGDNLCVLFVLPMIAIITISMIQLVCSAFVHPAIAYACTIIVLMLSAYDSIPWLIGNSLMAIRSDRMTVDGIPLKNAIICCVIACVGAILIGSILAKKSDISLRKTEVE